MPPEGYYGEDAIPILLPLAAVPCSNPDRLEVMRLAISAGCRVNPRMVESQLYGYSDLLQLSPWQNGTALHVAAERGDMEMGELLLGCGARADVWWHARVSAAEMARQNGHEEVAESIKRERAVQGRGVRAV